MKVIRVAGPTESARMRGAAHHRGRRDVSELHATLGCQLGSPNGAPPILAGALVELT